MFQYAKHFSLPKSSYRIAMLVFVLLVLSIDSVSALPAFARKYQANCALCHTNVPRLTPFGQRVLENGYQFPGTSDGAETAKIILDGEQGPVTLDRLSNMMAVRLRADIQRATFDKISPAMKSEGVDERVSVEVPKIINFFFGGTVTKNISYFMEAEYNTMEARGGETSIIFERAFMQFSNLAGAQGVANVKIGRFDPSFLFAFPTHRQQLNPILPIADTDKFPPEINRIPLLPLAFSSKMFGLSTASANAGSLVDDGFDEGFAILPFEPYLYNARVQTGISVHGRPMGDTSPFMYQVGFAFNDEARRGEQRTDTYAMLRYDFQVNAVQAQVSGFYYKAPDAAQATLININPGASMASMNDSADNVIVYAKNPTDITRVGIGARAQWALFDVYAAYITDSIDGPEWAAAPLQTSEWEKDGSGISAELDWRFKPNWMFGVRYDYMKSGGLKRLPTVATATGSINDRINTTVKFLSPILKYYPSPNISLYARTHLNLSSSSQLPDTVGRVSGFEGQEHPASNLQNIFTIGVDMAF
ncbi:MAG: TonB-dependent receptor [Gammaproteobacteria bacterium]|nr:TonB-dependent receptor [Gammaproteobacteria bacterium]